ncbi:MAG: hypothetical protein HDR22_07310 [Lachnospiraceae bacterium]|nr:hypothetical protein [Lachnospiraceae bacterium]
MKGKQKQWILMTAALIFSTVLSIAGTAHSMDADTYGLKDGLIKEQEKECLRKIKEVLKSYQCNNSGITMTKVIDRDGNRQYRILLHHKNIKDMDLTKKEKLKQDLENIGFCQENFSISYEFLP